MITLYADDNTHLITLKGLLNRSTGAAINDATVTVSVKTTADVLVKAATLTASGSSGDYSGTIDADLAAGKSYKVYVVITSGSLEAEFIETVQARTRTVN